MVQTSNKEEADGGEGSQESESTSGMPTWYFLPIFGMGLNGAFTVSTPGTAAMAGGFVGGLIAGYIAANVYLFASGFGPSTNLVSKRTWIATAVVSLPAALIGAYAGAYLLLGILFGVCEIVFRSAWKVVSSPEAA